MSEISLKPNFPNVQVMVGWKSNRKNFYYEIEIYNGNINKKPKAKLIDTRYSESKDLAHVLHVASAYAKIPKKLYEFLSNAASFETQQFFTLNVANGDYPNDQPEGYQFEDAT